MRVLVVGGAGYIGSHVAHELKRQGHEALIYDNLSTGRAELAEGFDLITGELCDSGRLAGALRRADAVMHFAALACVGESVAQPRKYFHNNVRGGLTLLDAAVDAGVKKIIFSSTCAVYGLPEKVPITEDVPRLPVNPYGATKLAFEHALEAYDQAYGVRFVSFRYFNAAGAEENGRVGECHSPETHLIPSAFEAINGRRDLLEIFGTDYPTPDGTCIRDYIHVSDLAEAHVRGLDYLSGEGVSVKLNLGTGRGHSVNEVVSTIESVTGRKVPRRVGARRAGDPAELVADPARAEKLLHWKAKRDLHQIVSTAWAWEQSDRRAAVLQACGA